MRTLAVLLLAALALLLVASPPAVERLRADVFDIYQRLLPLERTSAPAIVVAIDESALDRFGQWPWPRTRIAELLDAIAAREPAAVGFDIFFSEADRFSPERLARDLHGLSASAARELSSLPSSDDALAASMRKTRVVLGIAGSGAPDPRFTQPPRNPPVIFKAATEEPLAVFPGYLGHVRAIDAAAVSHGLISSGQEGEVVRVIPMVANVAGTVVPSLGVETLRAALDAPLRIVPSGHGLARLEFGDVSTRIQADGTAWLRMGPHDDERFVSAADVLQGRVAPDTIKGKVVLLGITGLGMLDYKTTPLGERVPGVEIHAQVIENLFNGVSLARPPAMVWLEGFLLAFLGGLVIAFAPRVQAFPAINLVVVMVALLAGGGFLAFRQAGLLFDPAWPAIGLTAVFVSVIVGTLSVAERQRRALREQAARMAGEVDAARRIQMGLLPDPAEAEAGDTRLSIAALLEPARNVGGDFYDCFRLEDGRVFVLVADVSGKGLPAALFMASAKSHLKSAALAGGSVGTILGRAQQLIARENPEQLFVTVFAAILDPASGVLESSNAGHEPPFVRRPEGVPERLKAAHGPPLCVVEDYEYPTSSRTLVPHEWICIVTDGATEAQNPAREFFGAERLRASLTWVPQDIGAHDLVQRLRDDVARFTDGAEPADDLTLLVLRWDGSDRTRMSPTTGYDEARATPRGMHQA